MNSRIDTLIEQCTIQQFSDCVGGYETFDKELFAKLIVKECGHLMVNIMFHGGVEPEAGYDIMMKHFGVEE